MSMQQGWYDDGSGQLRWWDGRQWTEHLAPASPPVASSQVPLVRRSSPVLGIMALGLAIAGTALAVIPSALDAHGFVMLTSFVFGMLLLAAAFVMSLIGTLRKSAAKWPSRIGLGLSTVGGMTATVVFVTAMLGSVAGTSPPEATSTEPPSSEAATERRSAEEIATFLEQNVRPADDKVYSDYLFECMGKSLYSSDLSDDELQTLLSIDADSLKSLVEQDPVCSAEIATVVAGDMHGAGAEVSIGSGVTLQVTVRPAQLRDAEPVLPGSPVTQEDIDYSWGDAAQTDGQVAVVTIVVRNKGDAAQSDNGAFFSLLDSSGKSITGSAGMFGTLDYPSDPFDISGVAPGGEKTFTEVYPVRAADIGQVKGDVLLISDMGEGYGFIIE